MDGGGAHKHGVVAPVAEVAGEARRLQIGCRLRRVELDGARVHDARVDALGRVLAPAGPRQREVQTTRVAVVGVAVRDRAIDGDRPACQHDDVSRRDLWKWKGAER